ncbi:MAG: 1-deoxy-D-xylulose-5-phosphate reductoisomerase [Phascolarctobacterium sp.]|nr:1-deoxy-D-xylulose-5-phosphate reductoisomerase [Phascolarctobacterium sp.]MBR5790770.1 1-deoxy-D-xylulose-5-phosphate reductoisomerase [Phascolarctobacterium sp.]
MKNISLLGSTGSIGKQTLEVAAANPDKMKIRVLAAHTSDTILEEQIRAVEPDFAVLTDKEAAARLKARYNGKTEILAGEEGLLAAATYSEVDTVLASMVGYAGLRPTMAAINCGKNIALANKETLVAAGSLVMEAVAKNNVSLTPVDSEHSAIFQALQGGKEDEVKRLLITASGGPFRGKKRSELETVTLAQCLNHPNWSMGKKITVDSSTLANKGLEVIEAHWLFNMPYEKIDVVVHPQSIIHSLVEFCDGSVIAQLGEPDMRLPIQYALSYPCRYHKAFDQLDLIKAGTLTFEAPDMEAFPSLRIAIDCGKAGGTLPCVFNAANEEAVYAFLDNKIKYLDIPYITEKVASLHQNIAAPCIEDIERADAEARAAAQSIIANL